MPEPQGQPARSPIARVGRVDVHALPIKVFIIVPKDGHVPPLELPAELAHWTRTPRNMFAMALHGQPELIVGAGSAAFLEDGRGGVLLYILTAAVDLTDGKAALVRRLVDAMTIFAKPDGATTVYLSDEVRAQLRDSLVAYWLGRLKAWIGRLDTRRS